VIYIRLYIFLTALFILYMSIFFTFQTLQKCHTGAI